MGWEIQLRLADRRAAGLRSLRLRTSSGLGLKYCSPAFSPEPLPSPASVHTTPMPLRPVCSRVWTAGAQPSCPCVSAEALQGLVSDEAYAYGALDKCGLTVVTFPPHQRPPDCSVPNLACVSTE